jgi:hypothetical protein
LLAARPYAAARCLLFYNSFLLTKLIILLYYLRAAASGLAAGKVRLLTATGGETASLLPTAVVKLLCYLATWFS